MTDTFAQTMTFFPSDPKQQIAVDDMVQEDLPDDSFIPLKAEQGK